MSIYSEHRLGYLTDDEFKQAVRDEAWLDKVRGDSGGDYDGDEGDEE